MHSLWNMWVHGRFLTSSFSSYSHWQIVHELFSFEGLFGFFLYLEEGRDVNWFRFSLGVLLSLPERTPNKCTKKPISGLLPWRDLFRLTIFWWSISDLRKSKSSGWLCLFGLFILTSSGVNIWTILDLFSGFCRPDCPKSPNTVLIRRKLSISVFIFCWFPFFIAILMFTFIFMSWYCSKDI